MSWRFRVPALVALAPARILNHWRWLAILLLLGVASVGVIWGYQEWRERRLNAALLAPPPKGDLRFLRHRSWTEHEGDYFSGMAEVVGPLQLYLAVENGSYVWGRCLLVNEGQRFHVNGRKTPAGEMVLLIGSTNSYLAGRLEGLPPVFVGRWISADGRTNLPVRLPSIAERHVIVALSGIPEGREDDLYVLHRTTVAYPMFLSTNEFLRRINDTLRDDSRKEAAELMHTDVKDAWRLHERIERELEHKIEREIDFASAHAVSLWETHYEYWGGAHGSYYINTRNYRNEKGSPEDISLKDLFEPRSGWEKRLAAYCLEELRRQEAYLIVNSLSVGMKDAALESAAPFLFTLSTAGIHCHYSPEELGPYGQGESEVLVPYGALRTCLRWDGPAALFGAKISRLQSALVKPARNAKQVRTKARQR